MEELRKRGNLDEESNLNGGALTWSTYKELSPELEIRQRLLHGWKTEQVRVNSV